MFIKISCESNREKKYCKEEFYIFIYTEKKSHLNLTIDVFSSVEIFKRNYVNIPIEVENPSQPEMNSPKEYKS